MQFLKNKKIVVVHDGNFHPDDVFCVALLSIILDDGIKVIRTRDESIISKADYVMDVGGEYNPAKNRFDHHQEGGAGSRGDSVITYSAFGLLWKEYGEKACGSRKIADILDRKLVEVIDADDCGFDLYKIVINGLKPFTLTDIIYSIRPTWKENNLEINKVFLKAVGLAKEILLREIKVIKDNLEAEMLVDEIYENSKDKRIIIFDKVYLPKTLLYKYSEPIFVIYKDRDGQRWRVTTIEKNEYSYECRKNFPEAWWGKDRAKLAEISGVADAVFCRNGGVFAGAESKEGAIEMAKIALNN